MSDIRLLLEEYAQITGRPLATLSVEEYLSFKKFEKKENMVVSVHKTETFDKEEVKSCTENPQEEKHEDKHEEACEDKKVTPIVITGPKAEARKEKNKDMQKQNKEAALALLRSVPG